MGNQLAGRAPSHLTTTDQCLQELPKLKLEKELGSSLLFKVARAWHKELERSVVIKVFVIPTDIGLPMDAYKTVFDMYESNSDRKSNVLCYFETLLTDRVAYLLREFVDYSLQERLNMRPFLTLDEKKWIAFQLLCALHQLHHTYEEDISTELGGKIIPSRTALCHGDVKIENILLTDWGWLYLSDIAPFKPAYLPADNPTEFGFFFDIARRQACNLAPERFCAGNETSRGAFKDETALAFQEDTFAAPGTINKPKSIAKQPLLPSMDMFACGCVFLELFTDSRRAFSLSELLMYRNSGDLDNVPLLKQVEDKHVRELIKMLLERSPEKRPSAEECLIKHRGKTFPEFFYRFLKNYMKAFLDCDVDSRISRVRRNMKDILEQQVPDREGPSPANSSLVLQVNVITSAIPYLQSEALKVESLTLLQEFARYLTADLVLDRIIPFMVDLMQGNHSSSEVRRHALECITQCLQRVTDNIAAADIDFFPDYLLPAISNVVTLRDTGQLEIKIIAAHALPTLAQTALRFLNAAQDRRLQAQEEERREIQCYDGELREVRSEVGEILMTLISDTNNRVRQVLTQPLSIVRLYDFFGPVESNEAISKHVITFLNDKDDPHLRTSFFRMLPSVAVFCGAQWTHMWHYLLELETHDVSEMVIEQCLRCVARLLQLGLLDRDTRRLLIYQGVIPLLAHPSVALRSVAVHVLAQYAKHGCPAEGYALLLALRKCQEDSIPSRYTSYGTTSKRASVVLSSLDVQLYFHKGLRHFNNEYTLWCHLRDPIPSNVIQKILHCDVPLHALLDLFKKRRCVRDMTRSGERPSYESLSEEKLITAMQSLVQLGLTEEMEDKLCDLHLVLKSLYDHSRVMNAMNQPPPTYSVSSSNDDTFAEGLIHTRGMPNSTVGTSNPSLPPCETIIVPLHHSLLPNYGTSDNKTLGADTESRNGNIFIPTANVEWKHMFMAEPPTNLMHSNSVSNLTTVPSLVNNSVLSMKHVASSTTFTDKPMSELEVSHHRQNSAQQRGFAPIPQSPLLLHSGSNAIVNTCASIQSSISKGHYCPKAVTQHITENMKFSTVTTSLQYQQILSQTPNQVRTANRSLPNSEVSLSSNVLPNPSNSTISTALWQSSLHSVKWKPKGVLVAHLQEHKVGSVDLLGSASGDTLVSCGLHGEVKFWTMRETHTKLPTRAQYTFRAPRDSSNVYGQCRDLIWLMGGSCVATCVDRSRIHVIDCNRGQPLTNWSINTDSPGDNNRCICLTGPPPYSSISTSEHVNSLTSPCLPVAGDRFLMYATTHQQVVGQDLRMPPERGAAKPWTATLAPEFGQATRMIMPSGNSWVTVGTTRGYLVTYDLRYRLPITHVKHPVPMASIYELKLHPATLRGEASWVFASHQYNNEVCLWDVENNQRQCVLWASVAPSLSQQKCGAHTVHSLLIGGSGHSNVNNKLSTAATGVEVPSLNESCYVVTGGTDSRIRYWDLNDAEKSNMISLAGGLEETLNLASANLYRSTYRRRVIEGITVYEENLHRPTTVDSNNILRPHQNTSGGIKSSSSLVRDASHGHSNTITGLSLVQVGSQPILVSGSADGVIKFWK